MLLYVILSIIINGFVCDNARPQVSTPLGMVRGSYYKSVQGRTYAAFEGIPYAKPPVKKYRFRDPRPVKAWEGTLEARFLYTCLQYHQYQKKVIGDEDCLYLNIYTPQMTPKTPLDVIAYIHGGAFMWGMGHAYKENIIMDRDVIYVSLNYRVGPFGFLSTEDNVVPGNMGMKDQAMALKWIKDNIEHFGGNPNSITLTGMSAGGASVHLHYLSPLSTGLFNRGFSMSGTALNSWVLQENALEKTKKLAQIVDCESADIRTTIQCMSHIPAREIVSAVPKFLEYLYMPFSPFGPVVEPTDSANPFLMDHPYKLLKTGQAQDVIWINSVAKDEGLFPSAEFVSDSKYLPEINSRWLELAPFILDYNYTSNPQEWSNIAAKAKTFYLQDSEISRQTFSKFVDMMSDRIFVADAVLAAKLQAKINTNPVYFYKFSYRGAHSKSEVMAGSNEDLGVAHGDDLVYVLYTDTDVSTTDSDKKMTKVLLDFWTQYAKDGVVSINNVQWKSVSKNLDEPLNYLEINSPDSVLEESKDIGNMQFWHSLPLRENHNLFANIKEEL